MDVGVGGGGGGGGGDGVGEGVGAGKSMYAIHAKLQKAPGMAPGAFLLTAVLALQ